MALAGSGVGGPFTLPASTWRIRCSSFRASEIASGRTLAGSAAVTVTSAISGPTRKTMSTPYMGGLPARARCPAKLQRSSPRRGAATGLKETSRPSAFRAPKSVSSLRQKAIPLCARAAELKSSTLVSIPSSPRPFAIAVRALSV